MEHVSATTQSEDARQFYQQRLALTYQVGFGLSLAFLIGNFVARVADRGQAVDTPSRIFHVLATILLAAIWWTLRHRKLRCEVLDVIDTGVVLVLSVLLNINAGLYVNRIVSIYNLALVTGLVAVVRAVVVPSTATRTLALGVIAGALAFSIFLLSAFHPAWPVVQRGAENWPMPYQLTAFVLWVGALVAVATVASRAIYHLRREVRAARKLGQYVLGDKLGEGGMGIVYRAQHALLRRETAIKLLPPDRVDPATIRRFEREVVETARLRHPSTVAIYDYGRTPDGVFYYAMEYLDGLTLGELVEREGPLPPGRVVWLLSQVCASLDEAHSTGLVHRDIKPANVMVVGHTAAYDLAKVLDFGLVKSQAPLDGGASLTNADHVTGTPLYMAPEVITDPDSSDARSDLYAVAAVGYYLLTGHHVFEGSSPIEIYAAHLHTAPAPLHQRLGREVPEDLEAVIVRGLAKSPADRPPNAGAFRAALLRCDVPRWTEDDARAWWRTHGERARRREARPLDLADAPTVTIELERDRASLLG
jgi:eukaryotic-like serine/threonine-protein kinase